MHCIRTLAVLGIAFGALIGGAFARPPLPATTLQELQVRIAAQLDRSEFAPAHWGIKVESLDTGKVLFERNPQAQFIPASNTKLFTAALALDQLGANYRIRTSLYGSARPDRRGALAGDLVLYGRGDPSFGLIPGVNPVESLVTGLVGSGVHRIEGGLVADESFFSGPETGSGWMVEDLSYDYSPEPSALSYRGNVVEWVVRPGVVAGAAALVSFFPKSELLTVSSRATTGPMGTPISLEARRLLGVNEVRIWGELPLGNGPLTNTLAIHRPAAWLGEELFRSLQGQGIRVRQGRRVIGDWERAIQPLDLTRQVELAAIQSPPLGELVMKMMKPSNNLQAQLLFLQVGAQQPVVKKGETTEERAAVAMRGFLRRALGREPNLFLEEGSGLSRRHAVSPDDVVALLRYMDRHPAAVAFRESLPIAGTDGTLRGRMRGTAAEANLQAKTGSLRGVNSLSGYVTTAAGERLAFSILLNQYISNDPRRHARAELDEVAVQLAEFQGRTR